jgi:hypothetical protein
VECRWVRRYLACANVKMIWDVLVGPAEDSPRLGWWGSSLVPLPVGG